MPKSKVAKSYIRTKFKRFVEKRSKNTHPLKDGKKKEK